MYKLEVIWTDSDKPDIEYFDDYIKAKLVEDDYKKTYPNTIEFISVTFAKWKDE